jgi:hypothetical protein
MKTSLEIITPLPQTKIINAWKHIKVKCPPIDGSEFGKL